MVSITGHVFMIAFQFHFWSKIFAVLWISLPAFSHCDKVLAAVLFQHSFAAPR